MPKARATTMKKIQAQQAYAGPVNGETAGKSEASCESIASQRHADYGKAISRPTPEPTLRTPKSPADIYKESLFLQVARGDLKFGKAVSMWEAYQDKEQKKQNRRTEVLSTPVAKSGLGTETDYRPQDKEQDRIYGNLKDMAERGLMSSKLAEAAWEHYAKTEYEKTLLQDAMTVKENLAIQINKGWISARQAGKAWDYFEKTQDQKFAKGPPTFAHR